MYRFRFSFFGVIHNKANHLVFTYMYCLGFGSVLLLPYTWSVKFFFRCVFLLW